MPGFDAVLAPLLQVFGEDPDLVKMMESMPLAALLGFSGQPEEAFVAVLDGLNAARTLAIAVGPFAARAVLRIETAVKLDRSSPSPLEESLTLA